jgi:hypothetical protein
MRGFAILPARGKWLRGGWIFPLGNIKFDYGIATPTARLLGPVSKGSKLEQSVKAENSSINRYDHSKGLARTLLP